VVCASYALKRERMVCIVTAVEGFLLKKEKVVGGFFGV
jgi:hypothetical protein